MPWRAWTATSRGTSFSGSGIAARRWRSANRTRISSAACRPPRRERRGGRSSRSIIVVVRRLPARRDVERALGAWRSVGARIAAELVVHVRADKPGGPRAHIAIEDRVAVAVVAPATHARGEGQRAGDDIVGLDMG